MKTIVITGSCDTKYREIAYMHEQVESQRVKTMVINMATGSDPSCGYDVSREDVTRAAKKEWAELEPKTKGEKIVFMMGVVVSYVEKLYKEGKTDRIPSAGGLQNTVMATNAMKRLPIGFPKIMITTMISGRKTFESVVGTKDIVMIPSTCDFTGLNVVTGQIMENACARCVGVVKCAGQILKKGDRPVADAILMGITNTGACVTIDRLERPGIETISFHSTGAGGVIMEQMAANGLIGGILDLTTHEIAQEYFRGGFSYGGDARYRPVRGMKKRVPLVVSVGGLDSIDFQVGGFPPCMDEEVYMMYNANTAHIKLLLDEAEITTARFAARTEKIDYPVKLLTLTDGVCHNARKGEVFYYKGVDDVIICQLKKIRNPNMETTTIPGNLDTKDWGIKAAHHIVDKPKERGAIGDEIQY